LLAGLDELRIDVDEVAYFVLVRKLEFRSSIKVILVQNHTFSDDCSYCLLILFRKTIEESGRQHFEDDPPFGFGAFRQFFPSSTFVLLATSHRFYGASISSILPSRVR